MSEMTVRNRLARLDAKTRMYHNRTVHLDARSMEELMSDPMIVWGGEVSTEPQPRWRGMHIQIHAMLGPILNAKPDEPIKWPRLISISYATPSSRRYWLDDELTDPAWKEGQVS